MCDNIDNELDELNELEQQLLKLKSGMENSKIEFKIDQHLSIDLESSPDNKKPKGIFKNSFNQKTNTLQSVTIDLNSTKGSKK
jgi:hypothetical protein